MSLSVPTYFKIHFGLFLLCVAAFSQSPAKKDAAGQDFSKEGAVIEQRTTKVIFQSDGTYTYDQRARVPAEPFTGSKTK